MQAADLVTVRVAYQGAPGAFSESAIASFFTDVRTTALPCGAFADVRHAVLSGMADYGVLPVENSIHGPVAEAIAVLGAGGLKSVAETTCPIHLCLLAPRHARVERLRRIVSHPVALGQCRRFLESIPAAEVVSFFDTAGAAREVAARGDVAAAAVASRVAADRYGLDILAERIEDQADNRTRFLLVTKGTGA